MSFQYEVDPRSSNPFLLLDSANVASALNLRIETSAPYSDQDPSMGAVLMGSRPRVNFIKNNVSIDAIYDSGANRLDAVVHLGVPASGIHITERLEDYFAEADSGIHAIKLGIAPDLLGVSFLSSDNESFVDLDLDVSLLGFAVDSLRHRICGKIADHNLEKS